MRKAILLSLTYLLAAAFLCAQDAQSHFDGKTWWDYVKALANDNMQGRETGSSGLRKSEAFVVDQLKKNGLQPAGVNGFYQPVKFVSRQIIEKDCSAALIRNGKSEPLQLGEDAIFSTRVELAPHVEAPLVFIGYGLTVPEKNYDDLAGLDLKGKAAVIFSGSPAEIPGALASHYQTAKERWKALQKAGAIGVISLPNPAFMDVPWSRIALNRTHPSMDLADPEFNETQGEQLSLFFNPAHADKLFAGSGHTFQEIADLGKDRKPLPHFALPAAIKATTKMEKKAIESDNIIAKLPGSDPQMKNEYVVLSAHIDHVGIGEPINGDRIYNGAMDDASGSAVLLDVASSLKKKPRRSETLPAVCIRNRRGKRSTRFQVLHRPSHGGSQIHGGRYQRRYVLAYRSPEDVDRVWTGRVRLRRSGARGRRDSWCVGTTRSGTSTQRVYPQ